MVSSFCQVKAADGCCSTEPRKPRRGVEAHGGDDLRCGRRRRRRHRRRNRPRRRDARPVGGAGRAARLGSRNLEPFEQADSRRHPLPGAARLRSGPRGPARADAHAGAIVPASGAPRPLPFPAHATRSGNGPTSAPAPCSTTCSPAAARFRAIATSRSTGRWRSFPLSSRTRVVGAIQYYDAQVDDARHTLTVARTAALHGAALATSARAVAMLESGSGVCGHPLSRPGERPRHRGARPPGDQCHRRLDRPDPVPGGARRHQGARLEGNPPRRPARPHPRRLRSDPAHQEQRSLRHPVEAPLDHRHHRHRLEPGPGASGGEPARHRLPAARRSTPSSPNRCPTPTSKACTPACARC